MNSRGLACVLLAAFPLTAAAQQPAPAVSVPSQSIQLDVVVDAKSGQAANIGQQDFTVLDNKTPRPITSFKTMNAAAEPVEVILYLDGVNTPFQMDAFMRKGVEEFLRANGGKLAQPTTIAFLTDQGVKITQGFSTSGTVLSDFLDHSDIGLRKAESITLLNSSDQFQICMNGFQQLLTYAATLPGRKIVLSISPGWAVIWGPRVFISPKQSQELFSTVVSFSTQMRQDDVTLYNINPVGPGKLTTASNYYEIYRKGVSSANDVQPGSLGVQVLAVQSGGLALAASSDVATNIQKCLDDLQSWYRITFDPLAGAKPNEYHHIEVKLAQPGLVARTRDGHY